MRQNPLASIGHVLAIPFRWLGTMLVRIYEMLLRKPVAYERASRLLAGGIGATIGLSIGAIIAPTISIFQNMKLIDVLKTVAGLAVFGFVADELWTTGEVIGFTLSLGIVGFLWGFGLLKMRAGLLRGVLSFVAAFLLLTAITMVVRWWFGYQPFDGSVVIVMAGMPAAFAFIWGMGGWNPENMTIEAVHDARVNPPPPKRNLGAFDGVRFNYRLLNWLGTQLWPRVRPLILPTVAVLGLALLVVIGVIVAGSLRPKIQTTDTNAAATAVGGFVEGFELFGQPVSKFVFFIGTALTILFNLALLAIVLALVINALGTGIARAKKAPNQPAMEEKEGRKPGRVSNGLSFIQRLIRFFIDWVADIFGVRADSPSGS